MKIHQLEQTQDLPISIKDAWDFFSSPRNLDEITPADMGFQIDSLKSDVMHEGQIITYKVKVMPGLWISWVTEIKAVEEGVSFIDEQRFGPYAFWHHRHHFTEIEGGVRMHDLIHYALPMGPLGVIPHSLFVRAKLMKIFGYRRQILEKRFGKL